MWKKLEISEHNYFINCASTGNENITCVLLSINNCWFATLTEHEIKQKVKLLNKRIEYNEFVKNTLLNSDLEQASIEELAEANISDGLSKRLLKLKYRVEELPFKFEWSLTQACTEEFHRNFFIPLLLTANACKQQMQELKSIIKKKDEEIKQYRREGFILHRTTVITRPFDADEFDNKCIDHKFMYNFEDMSKCVLAFQETDKLSKASSRAVMPLSEVKNDVKLPPKRSKSLTKGPKQRKRRAQETKREKLKKILRPARKIMQYESQSSQNLPNSLAVSENSETNQTETLACSKFNKVDWVPRRITERRITRSTSRILEELGTEAENSSSKNVTNNKQSITHLNEIPTTSGTLSGSQRAISSNLIYSPKREAKTPIKDFENCSRSVFDFSTDSDNEAEITVKRKKPKGKRSLIKKSGNSRQEISERIENSISNSGKCSNDVSSQLETIKKELQELEILRLADLKQRQRQI
uniref:Non-homologous end-joining factor 1 n=1 Tax=Glossina palpalis gambiensis TaxID=67801 RepID=A0A1B0C606_9MUSC